MSNVRPGDEPPLVDADTIHGEAAIDDPKVPNILLETIPSGADDESLGRRRLAARCGNRS